MVRSQKHGPVSLAIIPFCKAGTSKGLPEKFKRRWSIHPLHDNKELVEYLRAGIAAGRYEAMLHGYHHDEENRLFEFIGADDLARRVREGRKYLENILGTTIRVFVPPRNGIGRQGLRAIAAEGMHLGGVAGVRSGWNPFSRSTWVNMWRLRKWRLAGGQGVPWVIRLDDHREIPGNAVTPSSNPQENEARYDCARKLGGVFCIATHYWELDKACKPPTTGTVGEQLKHLVDRAKADPQVVWRSVGDILSL